MPGGAAPRRKGRRAEQELVRLLREAGLEAERVPVSGSAGGRFGGDVVVKLNGRWHRCQVKARRTGFVKLYRAVLEASGLPAVIRTSGHTRQLVRWLQGARWLFVKRDRMFWLVVWRDDSGEKLAVTNFSDWVARVKGVEQRGRQAKPVRT